MLLFESKFVNKNEELFTTLSNLFVNIYIYIYYFVQKQYPKK